MFSRIQSWDNRMLDRISRLRTKRLNRIMIIATNMGTGGAVWFVLSLILLPFQKYRTSGIAMIIAIVVSWFCGEIAIKNIVGRVRPCHKVSEDKLIIKNPSHYSFPSGHTTTSFAATTVMFFMHPILAIPMLFMAALIAFSRTYLLVHYITDVLAGMALGIITGCIVVPVVYSISVLNFA